MSPFVALALAVLSLTTAARAQPPSAEAPDASPPYIAAPAPAADPKSTILAGILMIVNGVIMSEADRRHQECATFVTGLHPNGLPIFRQVCLTPERR